MNVFFVTFMLSMYCCIFLSIFKEFVPNPFIPGMLYAKNTILRHYDYLRLIAIHVSFRKEDQQISQLSFLFILKCSPL